jgi:hypothetical protein
MLGADGVHLPLGLRAARRQQVTRLSVCQRYGVVHSGAALSSGVSGVGLGTEGRSVVG